MVKIKFSSFSRTSNLIKGRLTNIYTQVQAFEECDSLNPNQKSVIILLEQEVNTKYQEFNSKLESLNASDPEDYDEAAVSEIVDKISDLVIKIKGLISSKWPDLIVNLDVSHNESLNVTHTNSAGSAVKLPKISLPRFNGNINNWLNFYNLFETLVHNNTTLSDVEKLQFLLSSLEGEALNEVKSLPISPNNYIIAWNKIVKRYHNTRRLVSYHLNQIIDLPAMSTLSVKCLRSFISNFNQHAQALVPLGTDVIKQNPLLVTLLLRKVDTEMRKRFESSRTTPSDSMPNVDEFISFLENECSQMEATNFTHPSSSKVSFEPASFLKGQHTDKFNVMKSRKQTALLVSNNSNTYSCSYCNSKDHSIYKCNKFSNLKVHDRLKASKSLHLCSNCLGSSHTPKDCKSKHSCFHCNKRHHSLLHIEASDSVIHSSSDKPELTRTSHSHKDSNEHVQHSSSLPINSDFVGLTRQNDQTVVLATTLVRVTSTNGTSVVLRGLLDSCAQATFISEHASRLLKLTRMTFKSSNVNGLASTSVQTKGCSRLNINTLSGDTIVSSHPVIILDKITSPLPRSTLSPEVKKRVANLVLADPSFDKPGPIDILLGADLFAKVLHGDQYHLGDDMPTAVNTSFGFVLMGKSMIVDSSNENDANLVTLLSTNDIILHESLQRFWHLEEPPLHSKLTKEEEECEAQFSSTVSRDSTGRYITKLPFKDSPTKLGNSSQTAERIFHSLEKKFSTNHDFKDRYVEFMKDYIDSGHMSLCKNIPDQSEPHYYLPHHGIFKGDKIRVVFNASSNTSTNVSLNQLLHQGPKLQNDIVDIIFNFRRHNIVFTCDIRQMFRQILISPEDQKFQLIFWRENSNMPLETYQLSTVTYGMTSSPYLAIRTIQQLIKDEGSHHPLASTAMKDQIYVDDILLGADTVEQALDLQKDCVSLLSKGGFTLRKWSSNHVALLQNVPQDHLETPLALSSNEQPLYSILGIKWLPESDSFSYLVQLPHQEITKRTLLSSIARIYDPCGWISPLVFWAKSLMQRLWTLNLTWDEPLPDSIAQEWKTFLTELPAVEDIHIPRSLSVNNMSSVHLIGFGDASECGFAACVYIKSEDSSGSPNIRLLISKTRVAPLKRISLPRLELCAAHLLSKLVHHCKCLLALHLNITDITLWTDSTVALSWIQTAPFRLKTYIANRVALIQELTQPCMWRHIRSHENPADCASRGILAMNLKEHALWWQGPPWLLRPSEFWPISKTPKLRYEDLPEVKSSEASTLVASCQENPPFHDLFTRFSKWNSLLRTFGFILRFIRNVQPQKNIVVKRQGLTIDEINFSMHKICSVVQLIEFSVEISSLKNGKPCGKRLERLSPFVDNQGILRVGGRLRHSDMADGEKHPIILPKSHHVTDLIIDYYHQKFLHAGPHLLQSLIMKHFWILSARSAIRSRIFKCMTCFRWKPRFSTPMMGDLPASRLKSLRAFETCGTDYAGPFTVKIHKLKRVQPIKVYICLFICFSTKAIHIEIVTDLTSDAYIGALTRFVSRRGLPSHIYSDCGTNYIGAASETRKIIKEFLQKDSTQVSVEHFSTQNSITFHFSPAKAPNFGGLWERSVRSIKHHLRRVIGTQILTLEEFTTLCTNIEAILNSRPLTELSADPAEVDVLTPGHFLIGTALTSLPQRNHLDTNINRLRRWHMIQAFTQHIWKRWKSEYLHTLQSRSKWTSQKKPLQEGQLVVVHDDNAPPLSWSLARITALSPGKDGIPRVVHLKTKKGTLIRPVSKVSPLPIED